MSAILWTARHAPVDAAGICYGRSDVEVLRSTDASVDALAVAFPGGPPAQVVWSSPSERCRRVAEMLARRWKAQARCDEALYELDFGAWEGRRWTELQTNDGARFARWMDAWLDVAPPGGERPVDLERRVRGWLSSLDPMRTHALISHAGVARALHVVTRGVGWEEAMRLPVAHLEWLPISLEMNPEIALDVQPA